MRDEDVQRALRRATDQQLVEVVKRRAGKFLGTYEHCAVGSSGYLEGCPNSKVNHWCPQGGCQGLGVCVSCCAKHGCRGSEEIT